ncbi:MAG: Gfo/Idh/MocA family oxidoreductase [Spirochaetales bacterium]|nr:Gfo/Idh/MocA family oxidoreductase [Spirochaetales bacterium]
MTGIGIIGIGGFALNHLASIKECAQKKLCTLEAAVIRNPQKYETALKELKNDWPNLRIYPTLEDLLSKEKEKIGLVAIPSGIPSHRSYSEISLKAGKNVLCEKPAAGTIEDALAMKAAQEESGKSLAIGFQYMFCPSIQKIKEIIIDQSLGKLISLKATSRWKRTSIYYNRNRWAGCLKDGEDFIFDSPIQNANAHYLQNLLYLAGPSRYESALPLTLYGENYHAQDIESADTQYIKCTTAEGVTLSFAVTHATEEVDGPHMECLLEQGRICWTMKDGATRVYNKEDKLIEAFDNGESPLFTSVFEDTLKAIQENRPPLCHIGNAYQHTVCINHLYKATGGIWDIPEEAKSHNKVTEDPYLEYSTNLQYSDNDINTVIKGIDHTMKDMFDQGGIGYYEAGLPWARKGKTLDISLQ